MCLDYSTFQASRDLLAHCYWHPSNGFKKYLEFVLIRYGRHTDMEVTAMKE